MSCYQSNNPSLFTNQRAKSIDFVIAIKQVIRTEKISTVLISLVDCSKIKLQNIALAPECDSNLVSFSQLRETEIIFHDNPTTITVMNNRKIIILVKKDQKISNLKLVQQERAMLIIKSVSILPKVMAIQGQG